MSINSVTAMDVDSPTGANTLKRSSSAPMINDINNTIMTTSPSTNSSSRDNNTFSLFSTVQPRTRRFSASFSPVPGSPTLGPRLAPRISQIRLEECVEREVAHERDIHSQMQMSQSCEDLTLMNESLSLKNDSELKSSKDCKLMPLHINLGSCQSICSSPSPTRPGYSFSPAGAQFWKAQALSPSPSRKQTFFTRRSLSPIAIRQSPLGSIGSVKRKLDDDKLDMYACPRAKRFNSYNPNEQRGGLLMAHNNTSSPLPGSLSSVGTPESLSSADSPGFTFRPVDSPSPNRPMQSGTDEPMHEERVTQDSPLKLDQIMTSVDQSPS